MLSGPLSAAEACQPAPSTPSRAGAPGATPALISARWAVMAAVGGADRPEQLGRGVALIAGRDRTRPGASRARPRRG